MSHTTIWKKNLKLYSGHDDQWFGPVTYSACGEDLMVTQLFWLMGLKTPSYLDVGAHHPINISNTALLYSRGSRGVNVEANPKLMDAFLKERPDDKNINIGVALETGMKKFYMWDDRSGRNTFSEEASKQMEVLTETIDLPVTTLSKIVEEHCGGIWPDFLSMDIEGFDFAVLESTSLKDGPKVVCVEVRIDDTEKFVYMMSLKGYAVACRVALDLIFVREDKKKISGVP